MTSNSPSVTVNVVFSSVACFYQQVSLIPILSSSLTALAATNMPLIKECLQFTVTHNSKLSDGSFYTQPALKHRCFRNLDIPSLTPILLFE